MADLTLDEFADVADDIARGLPKAMRSGVLEAAQIVESNIRKAIFSTMVSTRESSIRTGALARSFKATLVRMSGSTITAGVYSTLIYAGIQDRGGVIFPRKTYLAIPVSRQAALRWPRDFAKGELQWRKKKGKDPVLVRVSKGGAGQLMYALKKSVTIDGKHYISLAMAKSRKPVAELLASRTQAFAEGDKDG